MFEQGFPVEMRDTVSRILPLLPCRTVNGMRSIVTEHCEDYSLEGELIRIPDRVYLMEPNRLPALLGTEEQAVIFCIYSRSCDGFVRERSVRFLLDLAWLPVWAIPYLVKVCDEYVVEILQTVYEGLMGREDGRILQFCAENPVQLQRSYARMTSYWNEFYRGAYPNFRDYVGRKLFLHFFGMSRCGRVRFKRS